MRTNPFRRLLAILAAAALTLGTSGAAAEDDPPLDRTTMQTLTSLGSLVLTLEAYQIDHKSYPRPAGGYVPAELLVPHLSPVYIRELPTRDAWGGPFLYASDGSRMALVSFGPDGVPDRAYDSLDTLVPAEGAGDDLVWSGGHLVVCPARLCRLERQGGQKRTMADLRSIGTAVEAYKIDNGVYPATEGYVAVAFLRSRVEPIYIRMLPLADAWSNPFLYWSDGEHYRVVSNGWDGAADRPYDEVVPGTTTQTFASDIVFGDGEFLQWPEGEQR